MAQPIPMPSAPQPEETPEARIAEACDRHADAIVSSLELLQTLHDRGVLDLLRGLVGAGDHLVGMATAAAGTPESMRALRNFILLTKFFASIPPDVLKSLVDTVERGAQREKERPAPGILHLMGRLRSPESRHAIAVMLDLLEGVGKGV